MMNLHEHDSLNINHFITGKYASLYLKRVFFFDSNPPLGKLLLAAVAFLTGFDGEVKQSPGRDVSKLLSKQKIGLFESRIIKQKKCP